jgi:parvulin-like peptidyl-prolyl isomerase
VAMVAGRPVHASELFSQWLYADSLGVLEHLDNLSVGRLVLAEAQRLGVSVSDEQAALTYEKGVEQLEREIQKKRPGITLDKYVDRVLGLDPDRYRERMRDDALRTMLGERVMRSWLLMSEHAHVRVIIVRSEDEAKAAQADLDAGTDFAEVAKKRSVDSSSKAGGSIAPVVKGDTPLGKLAFETEIGKVAGPVSDNGAWLLALVEARPTPLVGTWTQVAPAVEQSLLTAPVDKLEVSQWKAAMLRRYDVDLKPFLKIAGEQAAK